MNDFLQRMGSAVCHQMAERSFIMEGMQMPLCARCTGIYIGAFLAFCFLFLRKRMQADTFTLPQAFLTALAILPVGIDGVGSYLGFWESSQMMRVFTGSLVGVVTPGFLLVAGNYDPEQKEGQPVYEKTAGLLLMMVISVGLGFCLLTELPLYWAGAMVSVLGQVLLWGGVVWLVLKNMVKKEFPCWQISLAVSFVVLFLIGGLV